MSPVVGALLLIVGLTGAGVIVVVVLKLVWEKPDSAWEYLIAVLVGVALLIWPVAVQPSLRSTGKEVERFRQLLEIEDLGRYSLVHDRTGERLDIEIDAEGVVTLTRAEPQAPPAPQEPAGPEAVDPQDAPDGSTEADSEPRDAAEAPTE